MMMNLSKRHILSLVGGIAVFGVATSTMAQADAHAPKGKTPTATAPAQPEKEHKKDKEHDQAAQGNKVVNIGQAAPAFELKDTDGKTVKLSDFKGKIVVLEWF